jgi:hypothetical protein
MGQGSGPSVYLCCPLHSVDTLSQIDEEGSKDFATGFSFRLCKGVSTQSLATVCPLVAITNDSEKTFKKY